MESPPIPPEIKLCIADFLDPVSAFNFAITCQAHWRLLQYLVEKHGRFFAKYGVVGFKNPDDGDEDGSGDGTNSGTRVMWDLLKEILQDPGPSHYVRELNLPNRPLEDTNDPPPQEELDLFGSAALDVFSRYEYPSLRQFALQELYPTFLRKLAQGQDEAIIAILIHHLPDLRTFRFTDEWDHEDILLPLIRNMVATPLQSPSLPFQNLTTAMVSHWDTEYGANPYWCLFLICLPSLRNFVADQMAGDLDPERDRNGERLPLATAYPRSNVIELCLYRSQIHIDAMQNIIGCIFNLERFSYECGGAVVGYASMCPKRIIEALASHASHSLKDLVLEWGHDQWEEIGDGDSYTISLRSFKALNTLRCPWEILFPNTSNPSNDPVTHALDGEEKDNDSVDTRDPDEIFMSFDLRIILPTSLEALHLQAEPYESCYPPAAPFERLLQPSPLTPNLKQIYIEWWTDEKRKRHGTEHLDTVTPLPSMGQNALYALCEGHGAW